MEGKIGKKDRMAESWFKNFHIVSNTSKIGKKGNVAEFSSAFLSRSKKFFETPSNVGKKSKIGKTIL